MCELIWSNNIRRRAIFALFNSILPMHRDTTRSLSCHDFAECFRIVLSQTHDSLFLDRYCTVTRIACKTERGMYKDSLEKDNGAF